MAPATKERRDLCRDRAPEETSSGKALSSENSGPAAGEQGLFGVAAPEARRSSGTLLSPFLRHDSHGSKVAGLALTHPGMAGIAEPELNATCRQCLHWGEPANSSRDSWGTLRPQACKKYIGMTRVSPGRAPKLAPGTCACKYFTLNPWPPAMGRNG